MDLMDMSDCHDINCLDRIANELIEEFNQKCNPERKIGGIKRCKNRDFNPEEFMMLVGEFILLVHELHLSGKPVLQVYNKVQYIINYILELGRRTGRFNYLMEKINYLDLLSNDTMEY